jgi:branched-chain amino acid transport system permease protein
MNRPSPWLVGAIALLVALPFLGDNYFIRLSTFVCMYAALAFSWNFIGGMAGYPSFATAGFFGLGAYAGALAQNAGVWMPVAWLAAGAIAGAVGRCAGPMLLRMRGHYFAIGSIAVVEIFRLGASSWTSLTGGGEGLNLRLLPGGPAFAGRIFLFAMMATAAAALLSTVLVDRNRLGFGLRCIRQNEDAADMVGIDVTRAKSAAFTLSALWSGLVGAIYASWVGYIDPGDAFSVLVTLKVPVMVLLGGAGTVFGPLLGAGLFVVLEEVIWAQFLEYNRAILGMVIVLLIFLLPGGLLRLDLTSRTWRDLRWPGARGATEAP